MLITKFNKLIHNKILWGVFALLISVAFLFSFGAGSKGCGRGRAREGGVGTVLGENVSQREFAVARFFELGLRRNVNLPAEAEDALRERVWQRLAALRSAAQLGVRVSDREVAETIQQDRTFLVNGQFSRERYQAVLRQQVGIDALTFEEYLRQELTLEKMREFSSAFTWASPYEVEQSLGDLADLRTVSYVVLPREALTPEVTVSTNDVMAYFDEHQQMFEEPERVSVRYVAFDLTNYMDQVSILDTNVMEYYLDNQDDYTSTDTNGEEVVTAIDDVRDDIRTKLEHDAALALGMDEATMMVVSLFPGRGAPAVPFEQAVANAGLTIHTSALFSASEDVPGLAVGQEFRKAAFDLEADDPDLRFSDAIAGDHAVYVLGAHERVEAHLPEFEMLVDTVTPLALTNAQEEAFSGRVDDLREQMVDALESGRPFDRVCEVMSMNVSTTAQFAVYNGLPEDAEYANVLPRAVMSLDAGELSEAIPVAAGYLLAYVSTREPGDIGSTAMLRPQLAASLRQYRGGMSYRAWSTDMLSDGFEDFSKRDYDVEDEGEDEEPDE